MGRMIDLNILSGGRRVDEGPASMILLNSPLGRLGQR